jgi:hypothetical protein
MSFYMGNINGVLLWLHLLFFGFLFSYGQPAGGTATVDPPIARAHEPGTWRVIYVPGPGGIRAGGGIKVRMPKGFGSEGPNHISYLPFQTNDPFSRGYVTGSCTRNNVQVNLASTKTDPAINWDWDRVSLTFTARPVWGSMTADPVIVRPGDSLILEFGANPPFGSAFAPYSAFLDSVWVAADEDGNGTYQNVYPRPMIQTKPGAPHRLVSVGQTTQQVGVPFPLHLLVLDEYENLAEDFTGTIQLSLEDPLVGYALSVDFLPGDAGAKTLEVVLDRPGVFRFHAVAINQAGTTWDVWSNPIEAFVNRPPDHIYWGDLHSHSAISHDGYGRGNFAYARDVSKLDFYAQTDHTTNDYASNGITVIAYHDPGKFETILGYEISFRTPSGHQNVFLFADDSSLMSLPVFRRHTTTDVQQLWFLLRSTLPTYAKAFTIPHHTGILWDGINGAMVDLGPAYTDSLLRPMIEIFSSHGSSEKYPPEPGMSYQDYDPDRGSSAGRHYAQDALDLHHHVGFIAASDDHSARPGIRTRGIAAVQWPGLSREGIYDAIMARSAYGTTGERILLRFREENIPMGGKGKLVYGNLPRFHIAVHGTDDLEHIELLKWDFFGGARSLDNHPVFQASHHYHMGGRDTTYEYIDSSYAGPAVYYLRVKQKNMIFDNSLETPGFHDVWAWSSPIWIDMPEIASANEDMADLPPKELKLLQNYPNPFSVDTEIPFYASGSGKVEIGIYDLIGQRVETLTTQVFAPGYYTIRFRPEGLADGVYLYKVETGVQSETMRMIYLK